MAEEKKKASKIMKSKAELIMESKMPEAQKQAYLAEIGALPMPSMENKVPFSVYAKIKQIRISLHKAMQVYPKAVGVKLATFDEWESIFKDF